MPAGMLREFRSGANRAQAIIVSKCPANISTDEKKKIEEKIKRYSSAPVFFSGIKYAAPYSFFDEKIFDNRNETIFISGIADHRIPENYLKTILPKVSTVNFSDHHRFEITDLEMIYRTVNNEKKDWNNFNLITTEKDAMRLKPFQYWFAEKNISLFVLPIEIIFEKNEQEKFDKMILNFVEHEMSRATTID